MTELLTAAQMRAIERAAIDSGEVTGLELMERAGRGTVEAILEEWPELAAGERRAVVLCGPGNNGGDGFVVARLLRERGWAVEVFLYGHMVGELDGLPEDAAENAGRWVGSGGFVRPVVTPSGESDAVGEMMRNADLVVDALFGTGLARPVGPIWTLLTFWHSVFDDAFWPCGIASPPFVVALDVPSGLCADSGRVLLTGEPQADRLADPAAHLTVTFHGEKVGHRLHDGPTLCTKLRVVDIGLSAQAIAHRTSRGRDRPPVRLTMPSEAGEEWSTSLAKDSLFSAHKYDHGHALVFCGGPGKGGAGRMAARGALRIGAGLVTLGCPPAALQENASRVDAVMTRSVRGAEGLAAMLEDGRINALALGPGLGTGEREAALVRVALGGAAEAGDGGGGEHQDAPGSTRGLDRQAETGGAGGRGPGSGAGARAEGGKRSAEGDAAGRPSVVLDADALTILAREPALFALLHERCVLTPHPGEFGRLFPDLKERLDAPAETGPAYSKVDATREAAARAGCVVLHKGPDTVIAHPDGQAAINSAHYERSAPWLATAGAGDVLAGFIAGLLARGFAPMQAAEAAAWLHVECALEFGPGLIAEDLPEQLPAVFRRLGL